MPCFPNKTICVRPTLNNCLDKNMVLLYLARPYCKFCEAKIEIEAQNLFWCQPGISDELLNLVKVQRRPLTDFKVECLGSYRHSPLCCCTKYLWQEPQAGFAQLRRVARQNRSRLEDPLALIIRLCSSVTVTASLVLTAPCQQSCWTLVWRSAIFLTNFLPLPDRLICLSRIDTGGRFARFAWARLIRLEWFAWFACAGWIRLGRVPDLPQQDWLSCLVQLGKTPVLAGPILHRQIT